MEAVKNTNNVMDSRVYLMGINAFLIFAFIMLSASLHAQVTVKAEKEIDDIMTMYKRSNFQTPMVRAWRIQIVTTNDRSTMEKAIEKFKLLYPDIKYKWEHNPPYYQVRIGAYEKRKDLEALLLKLKDEFPAALPVQDDIEKVKIIYN